jgi:hypothetical protein
VKRRYSVILGALSLTLAVVAFYAIQVESAVSVQLIPFYQSAEFSDRDAMEFMNLQQLSYALDEIGPWLILAAIVPVIVILLVSMVSTRRASP